MIILIDENVKQIDKKVTRVSFCFVEVDDKNILNGIRKFVDSIRNDPIRFGGVDKIHFSSMAEAQRQSVIEYISKIKELISLEFNKDMVVKIVDNTKKNDENSLDLGFNVNIIE